MPAKIQDADQALLFLLRHPLRKRLLRLFIEEGEELRPKELADYTKQPLVTVALHVRVLRDQSAVELVKERPSRGAVEHFYRATGLVDGAVGATGVGATPDERNVTSPHQPKDQPERPEKTQIEDEAPTEMDQPGERAKGLRPESPKPSPRHQPQRTTLRTPPVRA